MANPINQLPDECKQLIKGYASDRLPPSQTSLLMKQLRFQYENETDLYGTYLPDRLMITTMPPTRFMTTIARDDCIRNYQLVDFLLSYWSDYANTFDSTAYDDPDLLRRLRWE